jgi:copper chaperone CopZ
MMSNTPRVFVGTTTFVILGMTSDACVRKVNAAVISYAGVRVVDADLLTGLVTVTADQPVNRANLAAALLRAGYTVLA